MSEEYRPAEEARQPEQEGPVQEEARQSAQEPEAPEEAQEEAESTEELQALIQSRSAVYGLLSRLYRSEVDEQLLDELHGMLYPVDSGNEDMDKGYLYIATYLSNLWSGSLEELRVDYSRTFLGNGVDGYAAAYPFESVYTSEKRLLMGDARKEVRRFYRRNGMKKNSDWKEGEDHLALELEFERVLCDRSLDALLEGDEDGAEKLLSTQYEFLREHLVSWFPMMAADMNRCAQTKLYLGLASLTKGFLDVDRVFLRDLLTTPEELVE